MKKSRLREITGISSATMARLGRNEPVSLQVILNICEVLQCDIGDMCTAVPNNGKQAEESINE